MRGGQGHKSHLGHTVLWHHLRNTPQLKSSVNIALEAGDLRSRSAALVLGRRWVSCRARGRKVTGLGTGWALNQHKNLAGQSGSPSSAFSVFWNMGMTMLLSQPSLGPGPRAGLWICLRALQPAAAIHRQLLRAAPQCRVLLWKAAVPGQLPASCRVCFVRHLAIESSEILVLAPPGAPGPFLCSCYLACSPCSDVPSLIHP